MAEKVQNKKRESGTGTALDSTEGRRSLDGHMTEVPWSGQRKEQGILATESELRQKSPETC